MSTLDITILIKILSHINLLLWKTFLKETESYGVHIFEVY